ncbi:hypothetical protein Y1Q_0003984 [Alligator mississippiensis]|uniref:Uncharacterized protein n=1 Tax=Alligator mississippiensis TaxID=8496 RepID=A0A151PHP9_ALLMI|nr:hypothetical protein Y1Q_0003984 [Alligator mississippiensis]
MQRQQQQLWANLKVCDYGQTSTVQSWGKLLFLLTTLLGARSLEEFRCPAGAWGRQSLHLSAKPLDSPFAATQSTSSIMCLGSG